MKYGLLTIFFLLPLLLHAQTATWQKTIGGPGNESAADMQPTSDGGYIITGTTNSFGAGNEDLYLVKMDSSGNVLWKKTYGGAGQDVSEKVLALDDGGFLVAGTTASFGAGGSDMYLVRADADGDILWSKTLGNTSIEEVRFVSKTKDGKYIVVGQINSLDTMTEPILMIKLDENGTLIWSKKINIPEMRYTTGCTTGDGGFLLAGRSFYTAALPYIILLFKTDSLGNVEWAKNLLSLNSSSAGGVICTADDGYLVTAYSSAGGNAVFIKTDSNGIVEWSRDINAGNYDVPVTALEKEQGQYLFAINSTDLQTNAHATFGALLKMDNAGNPLWTKKYNPTLNAVLPLQNGFQTCGSQFGDILITKTDVAGDGGCFYKDTSFTINTIGFYEMPQSATTDTSTITWSSAPTLTGSGGVDSLFCVATGIGEAPEAENNELQIYPNPAQETVTICFKQDISGTARIEIADITGRMIYAGTAAANVPVTIPLHTVASGVYCIRLITEKLRHTEKLVISR